MSTLWRDVSFGFRMLLKQPGFTMVAALTLALGIGASTSIFSVVNAVLLRPLPYPNPDRLVSIWETSPIKGWTNAPAAPANFYDWQEQCDAFEGMASYSTSPGNLALSGGDEPERLRAVVVSGNLFSVLGVQAAYGRAFLDEETWKGKSDVVVLSHGLWERRFGADPELIGKPISLDGKPYTVVGVMPKGFYFPTKEAELWTTWGFDPTKIQDLRRPHFVRVVARLKPDGSVEKARAEMTTIAGRLEEKYPGTNTKMGVGVGLMSDWIVSSTQLPLLILLGAVGFILLIACANIANLLLARASTRMSEMAVRTALGASRPRLIRQLLTESLLMSVVGGALGLLLAIWGKDMLLAFRPPSIPRFDEINIDVGVLAFTLTLSLATTIVSGLIPALAGSRTDLVSSLKEGGQKGGGNARHNRARNVLVVGEVAFALILLVAAGLMIKSFIRLERVNPGFDPNNLLTMQVSVASKYKTEAQQAGFYKEALERVRNVPGVSGAAVTLTIPSLGPAWTSDFTIEGRPPEEYGKEVRHNTVTPDYFRTMQIPLISGREFTDFDVKGSQSVILVNETLARGFFADEDPIGKRMKFRKPEFDDEWFTIVGVVANEKIEGLGSQVRTQVYQPFQQQPNDEVFLVMRTTTDPRSVAGSVRQAIRALDKDIPIFKISTMNEVLHESLARERFTVLLLTIFGGVALILSAVGIYGVMSYAVTQRTHEIGLRLALGADNRDVLRLVTFQGAKLAITGVAIGLAGAFALTRLIGVLLFEVGAADPATYLIISGLLTGVALGASFIPARRAMKLDPMVALRYE